MQFPQELCACTLQVVVFVQVLQAGGVPQEPHWA